MKGLNLVNLDKRTAIGIRGLTAAPTRYTLERGHFSIRKTLTAVAAASVTTLGLLLAAPGTAAAQEEMIHLSDCELMLEGQNSTCVALLQLALNKTGAPYNLNTDGSFGAGTRTAVLDFQGRNGLGADGNAGPEVTAALIRQVGDLNALDLGGPNPYPPAASDPATDATPCNDPGGSDCDLGAAIGQGKPAIECLGEALSSTVTQKIKEERARQNGQALPAPGAKPSYEEKEGTLKSASRKERLKVAKDLASKPIAAAKVFKCMLWDMPG